MSYYTTGRRRGGLGALAPADVTQAASGSVSGSGLRGTTAIIAMQQAINLFGKNISTDGVVGAGTLAALQSVLASLPGPAQFSVSAAFGGALSPPSTMFVAQHADDYARVLPQYAPKAAKPAGVTVTGTLTNLFGGLLKAPAPAPASAILYAPAPSSSGTSTLLLAAAAFGAVLLITRKKGR